MQLYRLFKTWFPFGYTSFGLTLLHKTTRHTIMQKVRRKSVYLFKINKHRSPTDCKRTVSGSLSLPSSGFFSPFPHGTSSLSVVSQYLGLDDGPPSFPPDFTCPVVLRNSSMLSFKFHLQDFHLLWSIIPKLVQLFNYRSKKLEPYNPT